MLIVMNNNKFFFSMTSVPVLITERKILLIKASTFFYEYIKWLSKIEIWSGCHILKNHL